ncbi:MAG: aminotransferase class I/II-fold pyridoxal phosphate-dependent enzyme, partial [Eubacterium aggregans]
MKKIDRWKSWDIKWCPEVLSQNIKARVDDNMLPLWVADMDFKSVPPIMAALEERLAHGIFGYCPATTPCLKAVAWWQGCRFGWRVNPECVQMTPTVVSAINIAMRAFTEPGDGVIVQQPVYRPFSDIVTGNGRLVVNNALVSDGAGYYTMDLEALRQQTADTRTKMLILCSPHNPVGRVWHPEELRALA